MHVNACDTSVNWVAAELAMQQLFAGLVKRRLFDSKQDSIPEAAKAVCHGEMLSVAKKIQKVTWPYI